MSETITFGGWLKQRRKELGITQDTLADRVNCSLITLQKIESGERRPSGQIARLLAETLNIPADEREAFTMFARTGQVALPADTPGSKTASAPWRVQSLQHTNLPIMLTTLIGREQEEASAHKLLLDAKVRLLTVAGPPGVGKTRLALQIASNIAAHFADGVFFVDLAPLDDPTKVLPEIARTLDLKESGELSVDALLMSYVRERKMLLVLDNFEQVLDAANEVVKLLQASPWLKVLVTSREALHVRGERRFPVRPLRVPGPTDFQQSPATTAAQPSLLTTLADYPSVELFVERAQAVAPDFELSQENAADVAAICAALEGLPLAIELTAARAGHISPADMRAALHSKHDIASIGARDVPPRQRTLRSAFEWSYSLINPTEQKLFRRLSVFVQGCTQESAEAVCNASGDLGAAVPQILESLVEKSLVQSLITGKAGDRPRYTMLETLHSYAESKLQAGDEGESDATQKTHALYFMRLAETAKQHLMDAEQSDWLTRLEKEHSNILATLSWAQRATAESADKQGSHESKKASEALDIWLRTASSCYLFWSIRGYYTEGREQLSAVVAATESLDIPSLDASFQGLVANALHANGVLISEQGDYTLAEKLVREGLKIRRRIGDLQGVATSLNNLGNIEFTQGRFDESFALFSESLTISEESNDTLRIAMVLNNLGCIAFEQRDYTGAQDFWNRTLTIERELEDAMGVSIALNNLGAIEVKQRNYAKARALYMESLGLRRELGNKAGIAMSLGEMAYAAQKQEEYAEAIRLYKETISIRQEVGDRPNICISFIGIGRAVSISGDYVRGARLLGAASALLEALNVVPQIETREMSNEGAALDREHLGEEAFAHAWAEGRQLTLEEAIALALAS